MCKRSLHAKAGAEFPPKPFLSKKIDILGEKRQVKKTVAMTLVCKAIAEWVIPGVSIKMRPVREFNATNARPDRIHPAYSRAHETYEHRLEPKIVSLMDISNPFERYLKGYTLEA